MQVLFQVTYTYRGKEKKIYFGNPDTEKEFKDLFDLRYRVYALKGYIDTNERSHDKDKDDEPGRSIYCIAKFEGEIIGTARLIQSHPLPTEDFFPDLESHGLPEDAKKKVEFSRLAVLPYEERKNIIFPRSFIMLFLMYTAALSAKNAGVAGGLGHVKEKLQKKLERIGVPLTFLKYGTMEYPPDGEIVPYFENQEGKINPFVFYAEEILEFYENFFRKNFLYKRINEKEIRLRSLSVVRLFQFFNLV